MPSLSLALLTLAGSLRNPSPLVGAWLSWVLCLTLLGLLLDQGRRSIGLLRTLPTHGGINPGPLRVWKFPTLTTSL